MGSIDPGNINLYRMIHIENLPFILRTGEIRCASHPDADPNYTPIGDQTLIPKRSNKTIKKSPGGSFQEYISFYFGARSPMLYVIKNGFKNVTRIPQNQIIYLVTSVQRVIDYTDEFVFFDGHAYEGFSRCLNSVEELDNIDWKAVNAIHWFSNSDPDLKRRKQAEFLVKNELPVSHLLGIAVYDDNAQVKVNELLSEFSINLPVRIRKKFYY